MQTLNPDRLRKKTPGPTRLQLVADLLDSIHLVKAAPNRRYRILLEIARSPIEGVYLVDLAARAGCPDLGAQIRLMERDGWILSTIRLRKTRRQIKFVQLTERGTAIVQRLLNPEPGIPIS